ncbi:MAG: DUF2155 domain-containing protein [Planktomarina sp.]|jgi:hypothetical protein|nr:DUF2155 domain-containing protein [Planktomarina sp.]MDT2058515.1 DUF2155 domain-containing protein [Planktomarina sp.]MDT2073768.1 DUF2155 domain-containing protein [Planktomarina sp.]MDT2079039.1 DUF2155 domain-containing protein [Planktomarina sp.]HAJ83851.1 DUF2155 domain-containing protein [Paracoccaceae bacterium]|tara:strand:+ start:649 stop:1005 length:357 start_codon:yes stop_codon:yes gene_type:complete
MIRFLVLILCLFPAFGSAQRASETKAGELRWLDRTTGELQSFIISIGEPVTLGPLDIHLKACRYPEGELSLDAFALLAIYDTRSKNQLFEGWMVASSPALNALEHPRYDVWVLRCKML